ncbi:hypothetical protein [Mycolicibacterium setense]
MVAHFWINRAAVTESAWKRYFAPALAAIGLGSVNYLAVANCTALLSDTGAIAAVFPPITFILPVIGAYYAIVLRRCRPDVYARIGSQQL